MANGGSKHPTAPQPDPKTAAGQSATEQPKTDKK